MQLEAHVHALDPVDEVGPKPRDLASKGDAGNALGDCLQEYPKFKGGKMPAEAEVRSVLMAGDRPESWPVRCAAILMPEHRRVLAQPRELPVGGPPRS